MISALKEKKPVTYQEMTEGKVDFRKDEGTTLRRWPLNLEAKKQRWEEAAKYTRDTEKGQQEQVRAACLPAGPSEGWRDQDRSRPLVRNVLHGLWEYGH